MKELVESIARALVDIRKKVQVRSVEGSQATILEYVCIRKTLVK